MDWKTCTLVSVLVLLCSPALCQRAKPAPRMSDVEADHIADLILEERSNKPIKALQLLKVTDPLKIQDEPESPEDSSEISGRSFNLLSKLASIASKLGRALSTATRAKLSSFIRGIRKATKYVVNKVATASKKVWEKIKSKIPGDLKERAKKAGKKLVKKVLREVFEEGAEMALEYVQAMVMEYIKEKSEEELCECPMTEETVKCRCCIKPPGFERACMVVRARPKLQFFVLSFRYNGTEFMKSKIAEDERGPCQKDTVDLSRKVCRNLPHYLHFLHMCFIPGSMFETEDGGFVGCFQLTVDSLKLGLERCVLYTPPSGDAKLGTTTLFTPEELGVESDT